MENNIAINDTALVDPVGKNKRMKMVRRLCIFILLVCILRVVVAALFYDPLHFWISALISLMGAIAIRLKNKGVLIAFGVFNIIQALFGFYILLVVNIEYYMPVGGTVFLSTVITLIMLSGVACFKLRRRLIEYERYHGEYPRCCSRRCQQNDNTAQPQQSQVQSEQPQQSQVQPQTLQIAQPSLSTNDFVMIPMQQPQPQLQPQPQPIYLQNQHIPLVYAASPQQLAPQPQLIPQPLFIPQQPLHQQQPFIFQPQQDPQQQLMIQQQQLMLQRAMLQQQMRQQPHIIQPQPQPNQQFGDYVYKI